MRTRIERLDRERKKRIGQEGKKRFRPAKNSFSFFFWAYLSTYLSWRSFGSDTVSCIVSFIEWHHSSQNVSCYQSADADPQHGRARGFLDMRCGRDGTAYRRKDNARTKVSFRQKSAYLEPDHHRRESDRILHVSDGEQRHDFSSSRYRDVHGEGWWNQDPCRLRLSGIKKKFPVFGCDNDRVFESP